MNATAIPVDQAELLVDDFRHQHAGHCESGVTSLLLSHYGLKISEPMAFGLSSSLMFVHFPFIKLGGLPVTAYRMLPGSIYQGLRRSIGVKMHRRRYRDPAMAMRDLDAELARGRAVGVQASVYWLPYFPTDMRFHFNAHNLIVYGKAGEDYLIADPVFEHPQRCPAADLQKARFARGLAAPKGLMYYPIRLPENIDYEQAVRRALHKTARMMTVPVPLLGVRAMHFLAKRLRALPQKYPDGRMARLYVGNIIRMQEEIGTGGGGFRFIEASFLQEAAEKLNNDLLAEASAQMTETGDAWRRFATIGARLCKQRRGNTEGYDDLADALLDCAALEARCYETFRRY